MAVKEKKHEKTEEEMARELLRLHEKKSDVLYSYELFFLGIVFAIIGAFWTEAIYDYYVELDETSLTFEFMVIITVIFIISMILAFYKLNQLRKEVDKIARDAKKIEEMQEKK